MRGGNGQGASKEAFVQAANLRLQAEGALEALLSLAEQRQPPLSMQALQLVHKVASMEASSAAAVGNSVLTLDALVRLVRFVGIDLLVSLC